MSGAVMRAKMVASVTQTKNEAGDVVQESMSFTCVAKSDGPYPADGLDENNTFAKWSPQGGASVTCLNPALFGKIKSGDKFYVDFTPAPQ